ncbi:uncharacterized protein N7469_009382 [Penicillium citrinum]|uniref:Uncharacterized protein n=2 Tax=Penicillium TaxID=5073 RepID=A0A9W9THK9_PENCI|nr:uncharacterized protein N7469_009382 [Penicillium citrinum]KAJ5223142.1 hypothetical protein N7469_009382 [Penicillium citrinum]KAJ5581310.1 hypothetical protein N7450_007611 [Penicillium hetheringtonii]KAK5788127.1 hypothetical protein VI817_009085 [Penicillium citrinum]
MQYLFGSGQAPQRQSGGSSTAEMRRKHIQFPRQSQLASDYASNKPTSDLALTKIIYTMSDTF